LKCEKIGTVENAEMENADRADDSTPVFSTSAFSALFSRSLFTKKNRKLNSKTTKTMQTLATLEVSFEFERNVLCNPRITSLLTYFLQI